MTAGLWPCLVYRPSGVDRLGEVPEHWDVKRLKSWLGVNEVILPEDIDPSYEFEYVDVGPEGGVKRIRQQIDLLRKYRTRLITDVVTDKLDVREAAARLLDNSEDPVSCAESDVMNTIDTETSSVADTGVKEIET